MQKENRQRQKAYLALENGAVFEGESFGAPRDAIGELVFTTGMTGYLETLTDPSYCGQIVVQTFPLIGNYGVISPDFESAAPRLSAYIVREVCADPSNFRCEGELDALLRERDIPGLCGVDTRALTRVVREHGVMNAGIFHRRADAEAAADRLAAYRVADAVPASACREERFDKAENARYHVVLWDFGAKENIRRCLLGRGCDVTTVPPGTSARRIAELAPDGVMLSNGPGDPADNVEIIRELAALAQRKIPMFGICLGHQLLALSQGARTSKLKYGHRGANQPVKDLNTGRVYITSQNHGYAVENESLPAHAAVRYVNANDGTCEGVDYTGFPAFSVQFHPEAAAGPLDTGFLFDRFQTMMEEHKRV